MDNLLNDECIETYCCACRQMIARSYGYLTSRTFDICLCGKVKNLRVGNFAIAITQMETAALTRRDVLARLRQIQPVAMQSSRGNHGQAA